MKFSKVQPTVPAGLQLATHSPLLGSQDSPASHVTGGCAARHCSVLGSQASTVHTLPSSQRISQFSRHEPSKSPWARWLFTAFWLTVSVEVGRVVRGDMAHGHL